MIPLLFKKHKAGTILAGEVVLFWTALATVLLVRYGATEFPTEFAVHTQPFALLMVVWFAVLYIADLYTYQKWSTTVENITTLLGALGTNFIISISLFYLFGGFFKLTPKLNLILFVLFFTLFSVLFRYCIARLLASRGHRTEVIFLTESQLAKTLAHHIEKHPQLGYVVRHMTATEAAAHTHTSEKKIFVVDSAFLQEDAQKGLLYSLRTERSDIETLAGMFERILERVPLSEIGEEWIIREIQSGNKTYVTIKRGIDLALAAVLFVVGSPIFVSIALAIACTSKGSVIYKQVRVGKDGAHFLLYKFRTMVLDAEKDGAQWSVAHDPRATKLGAFLRHTHLDEIPQLWNIFTGDMSFVGPRPERPEFTATLAPTIPHYKLRETILPGLTGWAQIKFRYSNTVIEAREKCEYDLYYIKNRSLIIDLEVLLKTVQFVFAGERKR